VLPRVDKDRNRLELYEIKGMTELKGGYMGIPEPSLTKDRLMDVNDIDAMIIPGVGFDLSGNRLGYGGGYYDILLAKLTKRIPLIALAYEEQIVESIPPEPYDRKVTIIITDKRIIRI
jgi:5-formyltetrahydrofolate cyclo-ligase